MPYILRSDGADDVVALPSGSTSSAGASAYVFWIKGTLRTAPAGLTGILGTSSSSNSNGFAMNATLQLRVYTAGVNRYGTGDGFFEVGVYHHYRLEHDAGGAWRAYRDDLITPVASSAFTSSSPLFVTLNQIFRSSNSSSMYGAWDLEELGITSATFSETYQADLSGGTGLILPTVSGNNQGVLAEPPWPAGDAEWIFVGGGYTITAASGAFTCAGTDVGLLRQFVIGANSGEYNLVGTDVTLTASSADAIPTDSGVFTLTGTNLGLLRGFRLTADSGAFTLTGAALGLIVDSGYRMVVDSGSYSLAGSAITLIGPAPQPASLSGDVYSAIIQGSVSISALIQKDAVNYGVVAGASKFTARVI